MIKLSEIVLFVFLFFTISTGVFLLFADIAVTNTKLDDASKQDMTNLNIYQNVTDNPFQEQPLNYSLSEYSNTNEFSQSNIETKGGLTKVMDIFSKDNNELSALTTPIAFITTMLPLGDAAFNWITGGVAAFIGIISFIAFIAAWKGGVF